MSPAEMESHCLEAIRQGRANVTLVLPEPLKFPAGFPHGARLSVNAAGERLHAIDPRRLLGWLLTTDTLPPKAPT